MFIFCFPNNIVQIILFLSVINIFNAFTVEELKGLNYEVDISSSPVKKGEINHPSVYITSRSGQEFQCLLPQLQEESSGKEDASEKDTDVLELLKPLKTSCLLKGKGWWTYEFCLGSYIKQFHIEDDGATGQIITLGLYDSDYDWNNETEQKKFKRTEQKYHSQYYTNGSKCDLTEQPRNAEVRIYCKEGAGDYIYSVDEPATCSYIINVHTSRLCSHPLLKPLTSKKAHPITCNPLLDEEQYSKYLKKLNEKKAHTEEKMGQQLTNQQKKLQVVKNENIITTDEKTEDVSSRESKPLKSLKETIRALLLKKLEKMKTVLPAEIFAALKDDIQKNFDDIVNEVKKDFDSGLIKESEVINSDVRKFEQDLLSEKFDKAVRDIVEIQEILNKAGMVIPDAKIDLEKLDDGSLKKDADEKKSAQNVGSLKKDADKKSAQNGNSLKKEADDKKSAQNDGSLKKEAGEKKSAQNDGSLKKEADEKKSAQNDISLKKEADEKKSAQNDGSLKKEADKKKSAQNKDSLKETSSDQTRTAVFYHDKHQVRIQELDLKSDASDKLIVISILGSYTDEEAQQEMKRHKKLEENYILNYNEQSDNKED